MLYVSYEKQTSKISPSIFTIHKKHYVFVIYQVQNTIFLIYFFDVQLDAECNNRPIVFLAFPGTMSWLGPQREFLGFNESPSSSINRSVRACCGCNEVVIFLSLSLSHSADSCPWLHAVWILFIAFFFHKWWTISAFTLFFLDKIHSLCHSRIKRWTVLSGLRKHNKNVN